MPGFRKMIVVTAFDRDAKGNLLTAFGPRYMETEESAIYTAQTLINDHAGVVAWSREANPAVGEEGPTIILYQHGQIPEFD
jgi:Zn-finger domain-containing protein